MVSLNKPDDRTRLEQLDAFIRACLDLPSFADAQVIRSALMERPDKLINWYENRRRQIGEGE